MFFQSSKKKKKILWRARVKQPATTLIQLTTHSRQILTTSTATPTTIAQTTSINTNNYLMQQHHYPEMDTIQQNQQQHQQHQQQQIIDETSSTCPMILHQQSSTSINNLMNCSGDRSDSSSMIDGQENFLSGCCYENSIESATDYEEDQTMSTTVSPIPTRSSTPQPISTSTASSIVNLVRRSTRRCRSTSSRPTSPIPITITKSDYTPLIKQKTSTTSNYPDSMGYHQLMKTTVTTNATAVTQQTNRTNTSTVVCNLMRNCCGGRNSYSTDSINCHQMYNNNNTEKLSTYTSIAPEMDYERNQYHVQNQDIIAPADEQLKILFQALMSKVKDAQLTILLQAVESLRRSQTTGTISSCCGIISSSSLPSSPGHQRDCVLVPRSLIMGLEPNVIACRIWRWSDIRNSTELKSIATCRNEKDRIYACCNPSHWSRLLIPETPPPPYQLHTSERLKSEDHASNENTREKENQTNDSLVDQKRDLRIQFPGSLTTENEDTSILSSTWCELAYWEYKQRVGGLFPVENSSVNIFFDQYRGDGMCLKTLAEQRQSTPEQVLKVRQKIGLGITLSQEADGVWLYNRSSCPVFVHSPTLNSVDYWFHVTKVPPDYCLKAYDNFKAQTQNFKWPSQIAGAQTGPVDIHSMRISFVKGWGSNYTRQDITACPCWLEVLLRR